LARARGARPHGARAAGGAWRSGRPAATALPVKGRVVVPPTLLPLPSRPTPRRGRS